MEESLRHIAVWTTTALIGWVGFTLQDVKVQQGIQSAQLAMIQRQMNEITQDKQYVAINR